MRKQDEKKSGIGKGWRRDNRGAESKVQRLKERPPNEDTGCWLVVGGGLQKTGGRWRKWWNRQIETDRLVKLLYNKIFCCWLHWALPQSVLQPDSRGQASQWDLASPRTLDKPAKCRFRSFPRLPAKLNVLLDKPSSIHNCKFLCSDPLVRNKHMVICGRHCNFCLSMQSPLTAVFVCDPQCIVGNFGSYYD